MIAFLYSTVGIILVCGYIPQIYTLIRTKSACRAISLKAWLIWEYTSFISLLYSVYVLPDLKLAIVNAINVTCIALIIGITAYKRWKYATAQIIMDGDIIEQL